ncbi:MAG: vitamin B12-dependent ribonucleotide reductase [Patescibacteria group bacterium]|nr:vitamin B12-dependent ribonucleotide reductase [Patescibacteria group bacterium]
MDQSISRGQEKQFFSVTDSLAAKEVPERVWQYLATVKNIKKRNGDVQDFNPDKLTKSIWYSFTDAGMKDAALARKVASQVLSRLAYQFNGHTTPTSDEVREIVQVTLIDHNLTHVAKCFIAYRQKKGQSLEKVPVYGPGIRFTRFFTVPGVHPYDAIEWERRDARITNDKGEVVFEQKDVEVPKAWSQTATNIVVSKYFRGQIGKPDRELSLKQMIDRVTKTITDWGRCGGYFETQEDAQAFEDELCYILANQYAAFNSPVWFNVGISERPQTSACFINSVQDDMRSILNLAMTEGMLFKYGSGTGSNLSSLRSSKEFLGSSSGKSSGPVSFMKGFDAFAGVIKSGGKTRRAAKMVILNIDHPDIVEFINCKSSEEKKAWALIDAGYDGSFDGEAYNSIFFQNANNSVRVNDDFMHAVEADEEWATKKVTTGETLEKFRAKDLMKQISKAAWICGDPGLQFDTTVNRWHTCPVSGRINASNPCSEYMFLDDSACNLASINLMKCRREDGEFDTQQFIHTARTLVTAQEIVIDNSSYPTPAIEQNARDFRPLGLGYANLGALLMSRGLAYDGDEGRNFAAGVTSLMTATAYDQSARLAERLGTFRCYPENEESFLRVIEMHRDASQRIEPAGAPPLLLETANRMWDEALAHGQESGYKNAQVTVLAPTGTIGFLMDCDTTGIEPDIALVKYKWLVGGGLIKMINHTVPEALADLGYPAEQVKLILEYIDANDTIEGAPNLKEEHLKVFDCAFKPQNGKRSIHYIGHVKMMSAVQPFLSGAISKTVNMPEDATEDEIAETYMLAWRSGLKAIAIYRNNSKRTQPLTTSKDGKDVKPAKAAEARAEEYKPRRRRMPDERRSITHKFSVANHEGYITVGMFDNGEPGEIFITMSKTGSVISGLMDAFATSVSIGMQYGVPLRVLVNKFAHMRFEPSGVTNNPNIRIAKSIIDYIFRWLSMKFLPAEEQAMIGINAPQELPQQIETQTPSEKVEEIDLKKQKLPLGRQLGQDDTVTFDMQADAPVCDTCGSMMVRNGACYKCLNCGGTSGCS